MTDSTVNDARIFPSQTGSAVILEVCVGDVMGLDAAIAGGADRIELCSALSVGGLSPSPALIRAAAAAPIPVHMLIRPRDGGFQYTAREASMIAADIDAAIQAGLAGIVIGASAADGSLDAALLKKLVDHANKDRLVSIGLHRAFDLCPDLAAALDTAAALGFDRILTSGGTPRAIDALESLAALHRRAAGRIAILAGSGISPATVAPILATGVREVHASCSSEVAIGETPERRFGFVGATLRQTDAGVVQQLKAAINESLAAHGA